MGSIRSRQIKRAARELVDKLPNELTIDFENNKSVIREKGLVPDKNMRNAVAGYTVRAVKNKQMREI